MTHPETAAYPQSWYAATMMPTAPRPPLASDLDVDVCVIGGGLAGLTAAREIARSGWSVALLEAGRVAGSASGRNTGFVLPGFAADPARLIDRVGFEQTRTLSSLAQTGLDYVRDTIAAEGAAEIDAEPGWLYVSKFDSAEALLRYGERLGQLGCEVEYWPTERVRAFLRSERYFQAINFLRAFSIHPLNYALKLAAAAERDGARIFENTPALSIDPGGVRKRIVTPWARLRADQIVLAGNIELRRLMPRLAATLIPITTYVITTQPLGARLGDVVAYRGAVSDTDLADNHYRVVGGDRLMWSGRATTWARSARHYVRALTGDIEKTYPQLGPVAAEFAWAGTLGNTVHRMPQIGELGPGVWLASGFGGHGLNTTALAGNLIARAVVHGDQTWRQFTPFELVWAGGVLGRAATQMRVWLKRFAEAAAERRGRRSELSRQQVQTVAAVEQRQSIVPAQSGDDTPSTPAAALADAPGSDPPEQRR